jgi:hypothetical protein
LFANVTYEYNFSEKYIIINYSKWNISEKWPKNNHLLSSYPLSNAIPLGFCTCNQSYSMWQGSQISLIIGWEYCSNGMISTKLYKTWIEIFWCFEDNQVFHMMILI